jgi:hypothetical protein
MCAAWAMHHRMVPVTESGLLPGGGNVPARLVLDHDRHPNPAETHRYYTDFGLTPGPDGWLSTQDGGRQLRLVQAPTRRLVEIVIGAGHQDDVDAAAAARLDKLGILVSREPGSITALEPTARFHTVLSASERIVQPGQPPTPYNGPGRTERAGGRAPGVLREEPVRPRRPGHVVMGSTDYEATRHRCR